ncbi:MAG: ATP-binding protein [Planctomycetota bacterium]|nr:ATP-binding protein [Planctomycetota bacterium]
MSTTSVLLVDGDAERLRQIASRLRSDRWRIVAVESVEKAEEALGREALAVALVDTASWSDGRLASLMAERHAVLPVIILTHGQVDHDGLVKQLRLGAMTFVPRDSSARRLHETLETIVSLTNRSPHRERVRQFLQGGSIQLRLGSDPAAVPLVVSYVQRVLEDYGLSSEKQCARTGLALTEALANAIIHGNLEVSSELRARDTEEYYRLIDERRGSDPFGGRCVDVEVRFGQASATFVVRDQGPGFDRTAVPDPTLPENLLKPSGRGIMLMRAYCETVAWNEKGNEVTLVKVLAEDEAAR